MGVGVGNARGEIQGVFEISKAEGQVRNVPNIKFHNRTSGLPITFFEK